MIGFNRTTSELKFHFGGGTLTKGKINDLQFTRRTVTGKLPARNQELCDHSMAPLPTHTQALECTKEIEHKCF